MKRFWGNVRPGKWIAPLLILLALGGAFSCAEKFAELYPGYSLRPEEAFAGGEEWEEGTLSGVSLTGWREDTGTAKTRFQELAGVTEVYYCGPLSNLESFSYLGGGEPSVLAEETECLVTEEFARSLWGSADVVGQEFSIETETSDSADSDPDDSDMAAEQGKLSLKVAGVTPGEDAVCWIPQEDFTGCTGMEAAPLDGENSDADAWTDDPVQEVKNLAGTLGMDDGWQGAVYGPQTTGFLCLLAALPLFVCVLAVLLRRYRVFRAARLKKVHRRILFWTVLFAAAFLLPIAAARLPGWMTPAKLSDFSWLLDLWKSGQARIREWLSVVPSLRDVRAGEILLRWFLCAAAEAVCAAWYLGRGAGDVKMNCREGIPVARLTKLQN